MTPDRVVVVGAGIAGLALAEELRRQASVGEGLDVTVLERSDRAGGNIHTWHEEGFLCEGGPNGFLDNAPETLALIDRIGLTDRLMPASDRAQRRYIYRDGRLHQIPGGPAGFLSSRVLSWPGKLRLLLEPFAAKRPEGDETIHGFAARRIGREAADVLIDAMVSGVFAGDARSLSLRSSFPRMFELESQYGGLFRALLAVQRQRRRERRAGGGAGMGAPSGRLTSFAGGLDDLIRGLVDSLGSVLRWNAPVIGLSASPRPSRGAAASYAVVVEGHAPVPADAVVLAGPPSQSAGIVDSLDGALARSLGGIASAPLCVLCLGYEAEAVRRQRGSLDGFGFLVPRGQGPRILGALWESSIFPNRAPGGRVLLRVMLGGAHNPEAIDLSDDGLMQVVRDDLSRTMGLGLAPSFVRIFRYPLGIPQYTVGHADRLDEIEAGLARHPGLFVAGNGYRGVSMNACIADAGPMAERVLAYLRSHPPASSAPARSTLVRAGG